MGTLEIMLYLIILFELLVLLFISFKSKNNNSSETTKYEITTIFTSCDLANKKIAEMQDKGWEIAGDIYVKEQSECNSMLISHIPMKRKIK